MSEQGFSLGMFVGPPRPVPLSVRLRLLFGGMANQLGWLFFGFGMIFFWIFACETDIAALWQFRGELQTAPGIVTQCDESGFEVNDARVYTHRYQFEHGGHSYQGVSYARGRNQSEGSQVTVEFPADRPQRSRIEGMDTAIMPVWALAIALFPIVGMAVLGYGFHRGLVAARLLRHGNLASGRLVSKEPTGSSVNEQRVYKLVFEFAAEDGSIRQVATSTHDTARLEDELDEPLVYDPGRPDSAVLLDSLPGTPRIDVQGQIAPLRLITVVWVLVLPTASVVGHGIYIYYRWFSAS
jgi:hypothetical protein